MAGRANPQWEEDGKQSLQPAARTASANGTGVNLFGFNGAVVYIAGGNWTDGTHTFTLEESDDDSTYTAVAAGDRDGSLPVISGSGTANRIYRIGYIGSKKYLRVVVTVAAATNGAVYAAFIVRCNPILAPITQTGQ